MITLIDRLKKGEILISDGAMGTSLQAMGLGLGQAPEEWNILNPEDVRKVHESFIGAGSNMIITNTFGANPVKLKTAGLSEKFKEINAAAVKIAKEAAKNTAYVLGDMGPTGEFLKPVGNCSEGDFYSVFVEQAEILAKSGVGAFIIETMSGLDELKIAVSACKKVGLPVIASMTFNVTQKGYRTMAGVSVEQAAESLLDLGCEVIGANCGCGSKQMTEIMQQFKKAAGNSAFLIAQPNAGMPKLVKDKTIFDETPADFARSVKGLVGLGVNIIGGCCGTTPEHIREIVKIVKIQNSKSK